jgi:hypothetical protein
MDFGSFVKEFGLPVAIIGVLGWFLFKELWPWAKAQVEIITRQREEERQQFLSTLAAYRALAEQQHARHFDTMMDFTHQLELLGKAVADIAIVVRSLTPRP